jgi:hypothetical protein
MKYSEKDIREKIQELRNSDLRQNQVDILDDLDFTISQVIKEIKG